MHNLINIWICINYGIYLVLQSYDIWKEYGSCEYQVEIGVKKYAKEGAGGERRAANSNSGINSQIF